MFLCVVGSSLYPQSQETKPLSGFALLASLLMFYCLTALQSKVCFLLAKKVVVL